MLLRFWEYFRGVFKVSGRIVSGPGFAVISIALTASGSLISDARTAAKILRVGILATVGLAVAVLIFAAPYKQWSEERNKREAEQAKNQRPELIWEACGFEAHGQGHGHEHGNWSAHAAFYFRLNLCNHRNVTTNIRAIKLEGASLYPAVKFASCSIVPETPFGSPPDTQLKEGIWEQFRVKSDATVDGLRLGEVTEIDLERLKIYVVDGFGGSHVIQTRAGEKLSFSRT